MGGRVYLPVSREERCSPIMGRGRPLVSGGCVFIGGCEMRHMWSVRPGYAVGNESSARVAVDLSYAREPCNVAVDRYARARPANRQGRPGGEAGSRAIPMRNAPGIADPAPSHEGRVAPDLAPTLRLCESQSEMGSLGLYRGDCRRTQRSVLTRHASARASLALGRIAARRATTAWPRRCIDTRQSFMPTPQPPPTR